MPDPTRVEVAFGRLPWWRRVWRKMLRKPEHDLGPAEWVDVTDRVVPGSVSFSDGPEPKRWPT